MPTFQFEAMDATGQEIKDLIEAPSEEEAQATIRQMGYFVTKISVKKARKAAAEKKKSGKKKSFAIGGVKSKVLTTFTRPVVHLAGRRPADLAQPANPRRAAKGGPPEEQLDRRLRRHRVGLDPVRGDGQAAQGLRPAVRQHDQGRRGGRCAWKSFSAAWPSSRKSPSR